VKEILGDDVPLRVDLNGRTVPGIITAPVRNRRLFVIMCTV
jgi:hypothetical protein